MKIETIGDAACRRIEAEYAARPAAKRAAKFVDALALAKACAAGLAR